MEKVESYLPGSGIIGKIVFIILALVALYYLYQFLFGPNGLEGQVLLNKIENASPDKPYTITADKLPVLYEGGEYTVNFWVYVNDYSINLGRNKHVLSIGGSSFLTLAIFLGPYKNSLSVRVHSREGSVAGVSQASMSMTPSPQDNSDNLIVSNLNTMFEVLQPDSGLLNTLRPCDIPSIDLQKWVQITVVLNNKTCDVYMDGKMARSCILPSFYKVDKSNLTLKLADYKGFGGFVSNLSAYNYALNPEQIWRLYMSGPGPQYTFLDYLKSLFDPSALGALEYPKQNITQ
jgi:hypothetical protein